MDLARGAGGWRVFFPLTMAVRALMTFPRADSDRLMFLASASRQAACIASTVKRMQT